MIIGFYPAHPAQYWMMKALYDAAPEGCEIKWYIRDKDITRQLIDSHGIPYKLVSRARTGLLGNGIELLLSIFKFMLYSHKDHIDLWLSKYGGVNIAAKIMRIKNLSFNDDDADIVPLIAKTSYPFADRVLCTAWTRMGQHQKKARQYASFHELFYLHPDRFYPSAEQALGTLKISELKPYALVRLSAMQAHHDIDEQGVSDQLLESLIARLKAKYQIYISSERLLKKQFQPYQLQAPPEKIHHIMAFACIIIGDSQTMIAEAAVLGIPCLRISSFNKRLGYLDELERRGLCESTSPSDHKEILTKLELIMQSKPEDMLKKRQLLLEETVDPIDFFWSEIYDTLGAQKKPA